MRQGLRPQPAAEEVQEGGSEKVMDHSWPVVLPDDDGIRPAGKPDECFYCNQKVGTPHGPECVCVHKRVRVRYTMEIEIEVPAFWDKQMVLSHRNESSWCADNCVNDIEAFLERLRHWDKDVGPAGWSGFCLCDGFACEVIDMGTGEVYGKAAAKREGRR